MNRPAGHRSGVREVVAYNWPLYTAGIAVAAGAGALHGGLPPRLRPVARAAGAAAAGLLASTTLATWLVYDRSGLYGFDWLDTLLPGPPAAHLVVGTGLDEASVPLAARWPGSRQTTVDLYDPAVMTEGSVRRARRRVPPPTHALPGRAGALPVPDASADAVLLFFAAHELRCRAERGRLFAECARALRPGGSIVLVEHLRDPANTAVFGPGAWHFYPRREWLRLADETGLRLAAERRIAGLVTAFSFTRGAGA
ncbi:methyltransferase domain-containing protein [Streptomyces sp. NPDC005573]|uniref:class I SAM-dependent methyltransferase n=1 Tax=Streptomyces sp. NPDC005573 TaxID=3156890 RepID=UPI0033A4BF8A